MVIKKIRYSDLSRVDSQRYVDSLFDSSNLPYKLDGKGSQWMKIIDNDDRIIAHVQGMASNLDGISGNGFQVTFIKAWDRCFDETDDADYQLHCLIDNYALDAFDYVWLKKCKFIGELECLSDFHAFKNNILIKYKNDKTNKNK